MERPQCANGDRAAPRSSANAGWSDLDEPHSLLPSLAGPVTVAGTPTFVDVLVETGLVDSKSAARRAIAEGGAYLNNIKITDPDRTVGAADLLPGRCVACVGASGQCAAVASNRELGGSPI